MARIIKRYENRKLYDTQASAYVSLAGLGELVRGGETVQVVDNASGDDLTAQTLTQIILDEGKRGVKPLPTEFLHDLLRRSGDALDARVTQVRHGVDDLVQQSVRRIQALLQRPQDDELTQLRDQLARLESMIGSLVQDESKSDNDPVTGATATGSGKPQKDK